MKIGIIFAMKEELDEFLKYIEFIKKYSIFNLNFYEGRINDIYCVLVESGIGKVNAARTTQILIDNMKADFIFNVGVAGGISRSLEIGDIVIGEKLVQHDFDITAFNHDKGYIPEIGVFIDSDDYLIKIAEKAIVGAKKGTIASGDIFCTDPKMSEKINRKFNALCVEMEGASIAQVCFLSHIPFLIIRSISDVPNNNNKVIYDEFLKSSSKKVAKGMYEIIQYLK